VATLEEEYKQNHRRLIPYAAKLTPWRNAEDEVQEAWVRVIPYHDPSRPLGRYLRRTLRSMMIDRIRRPRRHKQHQELSALDEQQIASSREPSPLDEAAKRETHQLLWVAVDWLIPIRARVIRLIVAEGLSFKEAARQMKISLKTAQNNYYYGIKDLRKILSNRSL
jgi:RNA polymerase sigma factor (sigma-70 family)